MKKALIVSSAVLLLSACMAAEPPVKVATTTTTSEATQSTTVKNPGEAPVTAVQSTGPVTTTESHVIAVQPSPYN